MTTPETNPTIELHVTEPNSRLDQFLAAAIPHLSRSQLKKLIQQGHVLLNQQPPRPSSTVQPGDTVSVRLPHAAPTTPQPQKIPLNIVYEDADLIALHKPAGLVVHPAPGHEQGTLVNALLAHYPNLATAFATPRRPGIVHRLDRDTSGLMLVARTPQALQNLQQQFKQRTVEKTYLALVFGQPDVPKGVIDVPLGRDPRQRQRFAPVASGKPARTHFRVRETFTNYSLLEIGLETGRTHQIRVHLAWLKHPVVGDTIYGHRRNKLELTRQFLHAWRLAFRHPRTNQPLNLESPLDDDLETILNHLRTL